MSKAGRTPPPRLIPLPPLMIPLPPLRLPASQLAPTPSARFSAREGLPLPEAADADGTNDVLGRDPTCVSLALCGVVEFEREWPHFITSVDGRMCTLNQSTSSRLVGRSVSSLFENENDQHAVFKCGSCANADKTGWFAFQGAIKGSSFQMVVGPVVQKAGGRRPAFLELVALPLAEGVPPQRGALARYDTSGAPNLSPHQYVDAVLKLRLCASEHIAIDLSTSIDSGASEDIDDAEVNAGFAGLGGNSSNAKAKSKHTTKESS